MAVDRNAAERAVRDFLRALGHDPNENPELARTPSLVVEAFERELLSGYGVDVARLIENESSPVEDGTPTGLVVLRDIEVATMCPHHLLPATGLATVAYVPGGRLIGLGTIARIVDSMARRLILQEEIGTSVVRVLTERAAARGAYCRLELRHACVGIRGARQPHAVAITVARAGETIDDAALHGGRVP